MPSTERKPRVLVITRNLPPLLGGMERLAQNLVCGMNEWAELTVIGPNGCGEHLPNDIDVIETSEKLGGFLILAFFLGLNTVRKKHYDMLLGGSGLVAPLLVLLCVGRNTRTAALLHGLDIVVDNTFYQRLFLPAIRRLNLIVANSANTRTLAVNRGVTEARITVINPGTTLPPAINDKALSATREQYNIEHENIIIFVGRMTQRKGLSGFIRKCLPSIVAAVPDTALVIVGENPEQSLNQKGEEREVIAAAEACGAGDHIRFLGHVSDHELSSCYALADAQILPLVDVPGDVEGFGMIAVEAAACGTPTVAFELGGVPDAIGPDNGVLIAPCDYAAFSDAVIRILQSQAPEAARCREHAERYAWPRYHRDIKNAVTATLQTRLGE